MTLARILLCNVFGALLVFSWSLPQLTLWTTVDDSIFWFFNQFITLRHPDWTMILALLNTRFFDAAAFGVMGILFALAMKHDPSPKRGFKWTGIGLVMLLTAGLLALFTNDGIRYGHASPTLFFAQAHHLTDIVSIPAKDSAHNSFPGDHGLMLMVFAGFMLKFASRRLATLSVALVVLLSAPRIMVGAHWFSDVYMGSLAIALIVLPWWLGTPLASTITRALADRLQHIARLMHLHR